QLPHPVPSEVVGANVRDPLAREEDDLGGLRTRLHSQQFAQQVSGVAIREVGVVKDKEGCDLCKVSAQQGKVYRASPFRRALEGIREGGTARAREEVRKFPQHLVRGCFGTEAPPQDVDAALEARDPLGRESGLADAWKAHDKEPAGP